MKMVLAITNETSHCAWHRVTPKSAILQTLYTKIMRLCKYSSKHLHSSKIILTFAPNKRNIATCPLDRCPVSAD